MFNIQRIHRILIWAVLLIGFPIIVDSQTATGRKLKFQNNEWTIQDEDAKIIQYKGKNALFLKSGFAYLDIAFKSGTIEFDIAVNGDTRFAGLLFRVEPEDNYEIVYLRPGSSRQDDAIQYAPTFRNSTAWQLYSGKGFIAPFEFPFDRWFHFKLKIAGQRAALYLDHSDKPALMIEELKRGDRTGTLALWAENGAHFTNFKYLKNEELPSPAQTTAQMNPGIIKEWEISEAFDAKERNLEIPLREAEKESMKWQTVQIEPPGMVVIDRYRENPSLLPEYFQDFTKRLEDIDGKKVIFARSIIRSDKPEVRKMSLGYSDEVTVFLNGKALFTGKSAFHFRDPQFLGIMDVESDAVYLDLQKGNNELLLAVSEIFGGWGFICRLD